MDVGKMERGIKGQGAEVWRQTDTQRGKNIKVLLRKREREENGRKKAELGMGSEGSDKETEGEGERRKDGSCSR